LDNNYNVLKKDLLNFLQENKQSFIKLRRSFHKIPELSRREYKTSDLIKKILKENNISYQSNIGEKTSIVAVIGNLKRDKTIALRADIDALPIKENTNLEYSSKHEGIMHACGHDFHIASVLATGIILNQYADRLSGNVKLIFQSAEEDGPLGGAEQMIEAGALDNPKVNVIFAMHVFPEIPKGSIAVLDGPIMAAVDNFKIRIIGKGGHAACPEDTIDPITIASQVIISFNSIISRKISPLDSAVLSIGKIEGGNRRNIIPDEVFLEGTMRTLNENTRNRLKKIIKQACEIISLSHGGKCIFEWISSYDVTINDKIATNIVRKGIENFINKQAIYEEAKPFMASEDFSKFLKKTKGAMFWVGTRTSELQSLHSAKLNIDDDVLLLGIKTFLGTILEYFF
jgi:amidohydrolase